MALTINNFIYRNLQEQVLYLTDKVGGHATVPANVTFPYGDPEVIYSTAEGAAILGKARLTYADGGDPVDIDIDFTLPVVGDGIDIDASEDAKHLVIKSNVGVGIIVTVPSGATQGTLTETQYQSLISNDNNWVVIDNERYLLMDKQHEAGMLVYTHDGYSTKGTQKYFCLTMSTRAFTIKESSGGNVLDFNFVTGKVVITESEFAKFKDPSLILWGYYEDPNETATGKVALELGQYTIDNDTGDEDYKFVPRMNIGRDVTLTASYNVGADEYSYTVLGGYIPLGTVVNFTIDDVVKTAIDAYTWRAWVSTSQGAGFFVSTTEEGKTVISSDEGTANSWIVDENENAVNPDDNIIPNAAYTTYAP